MRVCVLGLVMISVALAVLSQLDGESSYWLLLTGLVPLGAGMGLAMTPATAAITDALPLAKQGVGSAMNDLARELGGALGIAVMGSLMQSVYRSGMDSTGLAEPAAERARSSLAIAAQLGPAVKHQGEVAFADGMDLAFLCAAIIVAITAAIVGGLQWNPARSPLRGLPRQSTRSKPHPERAAEIPPTRTPEPRTDPS
jgi:fucose permease